LLGNIHREHQRFRKGEGEEIQKKWIVRPLIFLDLDEFKKKRKKTRAKEEKKEEQDFDTVIHHSEINSDIESSIMTSPYKNQSAINLMRMQLKGASTKSSIKQQRTKSTLDNTKWEESLMKQRMKTISEKQSPF